MPHRGKRQVSTTVSVWQTTRKEGWQMLRVQVEESSAEKQKEHEKERVVELSSPFVKRSILSLYHLVLFHVVWLTGRPSDPMPEAQETTGHEEEKRAREKEIVKSLLYRLELQRGKTFSGWATLRVRYTRAAAASKRRRKLTNERRSQWRKEPIKWRVEVKTKAQTKNWRIDFKSAKRYWKMTYSSNEWKFT